MTSETRKSHIDKKTGLPVRCPVCSSPYIVWRKIDWFCPDCAYEGVEALFPAKPKDGEGIGPIFHPQRPEQYIDLDLDPLSAAFLQRLSAKWQMSPKEAVVTLVKKAAEAEFRPQGETDGTHEVRNPRERGGSEPAPDDNPTHGPFRELSSSERRKRRKGQG